MKILISGSSGMIGSALVSSLTRRGETVVRLVRRAPSAGSAQVRWDPAAGAIDAAGLEGFDAVIHLAGDPIAAGRWTPQKKASIRDSRVIGTRLLSGALSTLAHPPKALLCASAVGIYGNRGDDFLREENKPGTGFLARVGWEWEEAAAPARQRGIRVVNLRLGIVLSRSGGALRMMLPPFRLGLGGPLGSGRQFMSWIALEDAVGVFEHALDRSELAGPVNAVAPQTVTNLEFSKTLGKVLHRPVLFPVPAFAVRLLFGEMADEALLASARVEPTRLLASGYQFRHPELEGALRSILEA